MTIAISKRKGTNAVMVAENVLQRIEPLQGSVIPSDVQMTITRDYGDTAKEKSNELLWHMLIAVVSVSMLIAITLGLRESLIVFIAIPVTLALTLAVFYLYGYTLNRITLFALIFSIGILVDDAIVVVENIVRHWRMPANHGRPPFEVAVEAVDEVGNPTILATLTVVAAILPMAFVGGLMGPYMRPIPIGASAAMVFSLMVAFMVTPWAAVRILKSSGSASRRRTGRSADTPLSPRHGRASASAAVALELSRRRGGPAAGSMSLFYIGFVKVKMLPFDNKSEFQVIVDMPNGTTLEETARVTQLLAEETQKQPEVVNVQTYVGTASPYNFNGLVRHYYLRRGSNVADIQVNLLPKSERKLQSHEIAKQVRARLEPDRRAIRRAHQGGRSAARTAGARNAGRRSLRPGSRRPDRARAADSRSVEAHRRRGGCGLVRGRRPAEVPPDRGSGEGRAERNLRGRHRAHDAGGVRRLPGRAAASASEKEDVPLTLRLDRATRSDLERMQSLKVAGRDGRLVALGELVHAEKVVEDKSIYHKNLMPVTYVTGDVAGAMESPVYAILKLGPEMDKIQSARRLSDRAAHGRAADRCRALLHEVGRRVAHHLRSVPRPGHRFRGGADPDLRAGGGLVPVVPHAAGHHGGDSVFAGRHSAGARPAARVLHGDVDDRLHRRRRNRGAEFDHPGGFHRAAAAGRHAARPSRDRCGRGPLPAHDADRGGGGGRSSVILFDPIFQGLAIALMAGEVASLLLSRMTVPVLFYVVNRRRKLV